MTSFQETLLILGALKGVFETELRILKRHKDEDDTLFVITNKVLIDIASFLEEWKRLNSYAKEDTNIRDTLKITSPALKRIMKWKDIVPMRNTMLAHGMRDDKNGGKATCVDARYFSANVPTNYAEIMLLAEFAVYAIATFLIRHNEDHEIAKSKMVIRGVPVQRGISTMDEFNRDLKELQEFLFKNDPTLKIGFRI